MPSLGPPSPLGLRSEFAAGCVSGYAYVRTVVRDASIEAGDRQCKAVGHLRQPWVSKAVSVMVDELFEFGMTARRQFACKPLKAENLRLASTIFNVFVKACPDTVV